MTPPNAKVVRRDRGTSLFIFAHIDARAIRAEVEAATNERVVDEFWGVSTRAYLSILEAYGGWSRYVERLAALYEIPAFEHTALACWSMGGDLGHDVLLDAYRLENANVLPDALVLLDAVYGSKPSGSVMGDGQVVWSAHLEVITQYALEAAEGSRICILIHAARATPYASSRECIQAILARVETALGHAVPRDESLTAAELEGRGFTQPLAIGNLHVLGFPGDSSQAVAETHLFDRAWQSWIPWARRRRAPADELPPTKRALPRLMVGSQGPFVSAWQAKLRDLGWPLAVDGIFGGPTSKATIELQRRSGLPADGVVTPATRAAAEPPASSSARGQGPGPPPFPVMGDAEREALFSTARHLAAPSADDPERIVIVGTWVADHVAYVCVPQLKCMAGAPASCVVPFHKLAAPQLVALWAAWEHAGLLPLILSWGGSWMPRFVRGRPGVLSRHAEGLAFDINTPWNPLGRPAAIGTVGSVVPLVALARAHGFFWGNDFHGRPEPTHFEIARLVRVG